MPRVSSVSIGIFLRRLAVSFFLFAVVLFVLLLLSRMFFLPILTHVEINGVSLSPLELKMHSEDVKNQIVTLERQRTVFMEPSGDALVRGLRETRRAEEQLFALRSQVGEMARGLVSDAPDAVHILGMRIVPSEGALEVEGDIRFVGPRSMTVLAQFADALRGMEGVASVETGRFTREEDPIIGFHSPFTFRLLLDQ